MEVIQTIHSVVRWIAVVVSVLALVKFVVGWLMKMEYTGMDRGLMSGFVGLLDLQLLLGLILLFGLGFSVPYRLEHTGTMIVAVALGHLSARWRKSEDATLKFRNNSIVIVVVIGLIFVGISVLPQGWFG